MWNNHGVDLQERMDGNNKTPIAKKQFLSSTTGHGFTHSGALPDINTDNIQGDHQKMNSNHLTSPTTHTVSTSTAFRLPIRLLQVIDEWCDENDTTRSQFFRRSIMDRVKSLGIIGSAESNADQPKSPGDNSVTEVLKEGPLYARLERRR